MEYCRIKAGTPCVAPREGVTLPTLTPAETAGSGRPIKRGRRSNPRKQPAQPERKHEPGIAQFGSHYFLRRHGSPIMKISSTIIRIQRLSGVCSIGSCISAPFPLASAHAHVLGNEREYHEQIHSQNKLDYSLDSVHRPSHRGQDSARSGFSRHAMLRNASAAAGRPSLMARSPASSHWRATESASVWFWQVMRA